MLLFTANGVAYVHEVTVNSNNQIQKTEDIHGRKNVSKKGCYI